MKKLLFVIIALLPTMGWLAYAQTPPAQVQQAPTRQDAATGVCSTATAVGASSDTCTITPPSGLYVYLTTLQLAACLDGTASISSVQQNFTTTNLGGLVVETSIISGSTSTTNAGAILCDRVDGVKSAPLKSAQAGVAVTITAPTSAAHVSFPITTTYYFAP